MKESCPRMTLNRRLGWLFGEKMGVFAGECCHINYILEPAVQFQHFAELHKDHGPTAE